MSPKRGREAGRARLARPRIPLHRRGGWWFPLGAPSFLHGRPQCGPLAAPAHGGPAYKPEQDTPAS